MINMRSIMVAVLTGFTWAATASALTPAQKCEKAKNKAAAKYGQCISAQRGREIGGKIPDFASCTTKLSDAFAKAEQKAVDAGSACPTTGDAAAILARTDGTFNPSRGLPKWFSNTRFVDNGNGTVSDTLTGLMWEKKTDDGTIHDKDNFYNWSSSGTAPDGEAYIIFLATLNNCTSGDGTTISGGFAGHCDWRLPTIAELQTIIVGINPTIFGPTQSDYYWSSTTLAGIPLNAWGVYFYDGSLFTADKGSTPNYVRAVRGGF
jgi:hypothetical protein